MREIDRMDFLRYIDVMIYEARHRRERGETPDEREPGRDGVVELRHGSLDDLLK